jgi:16S rRNA (cytosine967-C5)-methyltransferase
VELIKKYARRMGAELSCVCADASMLNPEWVGRFDLVICDVPCSGLGVKGKPDILLNRSDSDIDALSRLQYDILSTSANYVKTGGVLCYSTCTLLKEENEDVANKFLSAHKSFVPSPIKDENIEDNDGMVNLYPMRYGSDSFFIAKFRRLPQ